MRKFVTSIEFWILFFFVVRLFGITNPPLEIGHNWRQVTGLMVSRNFLEEDANILYPRIDDTNGSTGIIGMEFPLMNYLYFLVAKCFGYAHWYGRVINLVISSIGLLYFSKLISRFFEKRVVLASTILLGSSIWFAFSRKMMPDTFCISLMFVGLFYGLSYLDRGRILDLLLYMFFSSLAILSKIPAGIYLGVLLVAVITASVEVKRKAFLGIATLFPVIVSYSWYFVWNVKLSREFGNWYNLGQSFSVGFSELLSNIGKVAENFYFNSFSSYFAFVFFLSGLVLMVTQKNRVLLLIFSSTFIVFLAYMIKSGFYFYHHSYYILPFVPVMALVAGFAVSRIRKPLVYTGVLLLVVVEGISNQQHDFFVKDSERYKMNLEMIADSISFPKELIAINGNENPQLIYLSHRKGWNCSDAQLTDSLYIHSIAERGCRYIFVNLHTHSGDLTWEKIYLDENFCVYKIGQLSTYIHP